MASKKPLEKQSLKIKAPAKVNLFLHVTGKRNNGYHNLESLFVFTEFGDEISIKESIEDKISFKGKFSKNLDSKNNTAIKALSLFKKETGIKTEYNIKIKKNIPVEAGLGGGSADAASVLNSLNKLNKNKLSKEKLKEIAFRIGADVPACLYKTAVLVTGIGEKIRPVKIKDKLFILLVNPLKNLSTEKVFKEGFTKYEKEKFYNKKTLLLDEIIKQKNSLEENAVKIVPEIKEVLGLIDKTKNCQLSRMSGSGATCFGIYKTKKDLDNAFAFIKKHKKSWWFQKTKLTSF